LHSLVLITCWQPKTITWHGKSWILPDRVQHLTLKRHATTCRSSMQHVPRTTKSPVLHGQSVFRSHAWCTFHQGGQVMSGTCSHHGKSSTARSRSFSAWGATSPASKAWQLIGCPSSAHSKLRTHQKCGWKMLEDRQSIQGLQCAQPLPQLLLHFGRNPVVRVYTIQLMYCNVQ
jgi:hypothetical protein